MSSVPVKYPYRPSPRWALWSWIDIPSKVDHGFVYLRRLRIIQTPWFGLYLHFIYEPDTDKDPHDHPWVFWSFVLRGGYEEVVYPYVHVHRDFAAKVKRWGRFSIHRFPLDWAHQIVALKPHTISLVFVGRRRARSWGFYTSDGFVPYKEYGEVQRILSEQQRDPWE